MTLKEIHHTVKRPGRTQDHEPVEIPVAEELATVPGIVKKDNDVAWYSRNYPIVSQNVKRPLTESGLGLFIPVRCMNTGSTTTR